MNKIELDDQALMRQAVWTQNVYFRELEETVDGFRELPVEVQVALINGCNKDFTMSAFLKRLEELIDAIRELKE